MKNQKKGFIVPLLIGVIAVLLIGGGVYIYSTKKVAETPVVINSNLPTQTGQTQQTNNQTSTTSNIISIKPLIKSVLPTGLIPQNATVTIMGSGFTSTGNVISVGYANTISNYRAKNREFILPSSSNGTKITFIPENYGIVGETQAVGGGWLTVITPNGVSNSINLEVVKAPIVQTQNEVKIFARFDKTLSDSFGVNYFKAKDTNGNIYKFIYDGSTVQDYYPAGVDTPYQKGNFSAWLSSARNCWAGIAPEGALSSEHADLLCSGVAKAYFVGTDAGSKTIYLKKVITETN